MDGEGDYEIPAEDLPYVQEVELERANVARAPNKVMDKALQAALEKIERRLTSIPIQRAGSCTALTADESTRTIDAPLENLALYQYLMTPQGVEAASMAGVTGPLVGGTRRVRSWVRIDRSGLGSLGAARRRVEQDRRNHPRRDDLREHHAWRERCRSEWWNA